MTPPMGDVDAPLAPPVENGPSGESSALVLARWTSLSVDEAVREYDVLAGINAALPKSKAALVMPGFEWIAGERLRQIALLCVAAMNTGLLAEYCFAIVARERARGRPLEQLSQILHRITQPGTPQAVLDPATGFTSTDLLDVLSDYAKAIGYVEEIDGTIRGTALLVRSNVVVTSAHVAFEPRAVGGRISTVPPLRPIKRICFPKTRGGAQEARLAEPDPVIAFSQALMIGVMQLDPQVDPASLTRLDYAFLKLDRPIDRVDPIKPEGAAVTVDGKHTFLIGYPQSTRSVFDTNKLVKDQANGGRVLHTINTVGGMSGGCLIDNRGVPVGLHEGSLGTQNRAILLKAISDDLKAGGTNPLDALERTPGLVMQEEALVTRLGRRGAQLISDPDRLAEWEALFAGVTGPTKDGSPWTAHPWFADKGRASIEKWFATAAGSTESNSRVAYINGPRGSGKTFMIDVLKRIVTDQGSDVFRVAWSEGDTTLATLGRLLASAPSESGTRTAEGHERYETVQDIVDALERYGLPPGSTDPRTRRLFVAIDAGDGTGSVTEPDTWIELVVALARHPWARVVLCGLPEGLMQRVDDTLPDSIFSAAFTLGYIRSPHIQTFLEGLGIRPETSGNDQPAAAAVTPQQAAATFDNPAVVGTWPVELTTALGALCAIGWHRGLLKVEPGGGQ